MTELPKKIKKVRQSNASRYLNLYPKVNIKDAKKTFKLEDGVLYRYSVQHGWRLVTTTVPDRKGYIVTFQKTLIKGQDLAWLLIHGAWPKEPIIAIDKNYCNLRPNNLALSSSQIVSLGNYLVRQEGRYWSVKVWHHPYFYKGNRFAKKEDAVAWAITQLDTYNKYGTVTQASSDNTSDEMPTQHSGVYYFKLRGLYTVKVKQDGVWKHHSYCHNIEDAIETQVKAQSEIDEIWGNSDE